MTWETFYDRCGDWSESTQIKHISSLTDFGPSSEVCDAVGYMTEKAATKLVRKAIASGVKFSAEDLEELDFYVDSMYMEELTQKHTGGMTWPIFYDHFTDWDEATRRKQALEQRHFGPTEEITEIAYDLHNENLATQFIRNAMAAGVKFSSDDVQELDGTVDQAMYENLLAMLGEGLTWELFYDSYSSWSKELFKKHVQNQREFGPSDEVCEVANEVEDRALCTEFIRNAIKMDVEFTAGEVIELADLVNPDLIAEIVENQKLELTPDQLDDMSYSLNKTATSRIAKACGIKLDADGHVVRPPTEEELAFAQLVENVQILDNMIQQEEARRRAKPGLGTFLLAALAAFGSSGSKHKGNRHARKHNGRCDGDCANCPPHYGYRYGRWYYGRHHQYGCQFGGNRGGGGLD